MYKIYEIKKRIFDDNDQEADKVRKELKEDGNISYQSYVIARRREDDDP